VVVQENEPRSPRCPRRIANLLAVTKDDRYRVAILLASQAGTPRAACGCRSSRKGSEVSRK
jgi:hypothetical protein